MIDISASATGICAEEICRGICLVPAIRQQSAARSTNPVMPVSGSADAVKTPPSPRPSRGLPARAAASTPGEVRGSSAISRIAWAPKNDLGHSDWLATGRRLGAIGRCSQWWVGDWVRYGTSRWGEKYAEAARVTGYDVASLRNMAWVASRFDLSLRSDKLTWSHHVLLAPFDTEVQREWLRRASEERLSVADLRLELRALREAAPKQSSEKVPAVRGPAGAVTCPHCGHTLDALDGARAATETT